MYLGVWKSLGKIYWCVKKRFPFRMVLCDVNLKEIPKSTFFGHPYGITIRDGTVLGERCVFASNVTIGQRWNEDDRAVIGNNVYFGTGSIVLGAVRIPDNTIVRAGGLVK